MEDAKRSRDWCFTVNNYKEADIATISNVATTSQYCIYGKETAKTGTPHLQGYIYFKDAKSFSKMRKLLPNGAHIEPTAGTPQQASNYCKKDNDYTEFGTLPEKQGKRTDLENVREIVRETGKMRDVIMSATSYQSVRMAECMLKYFESPRTFKTYVSWYWGATGTGKTRRAYEVLGEDTYTCLTTGQWFEGYDGHQNVIVDDIRENFMSFNDFIKFIDRYEFRVQCKGGSRQFKPRRMIITSPYHPSYIFNVPDEDMNQLIRRIDEIVEFV